MGHERPRGSVSSRKLRENVEQEGHDGQDQEGRKDAEHQGKQQRYGEALSDGVESDGPITAEVLDDELQLHREVEAVGLAASKAVSYTHLTLPTIYSV